MTIREATADPDLPHLNDDEEVLSKAEPFLAMPRQALARCLYAPPWRSINYP